MAAAGVGQEFVQQIAASVAVMPQVMVGVADGQVRLQGFLYCEGQPLIMIAWCHNYSAPVVVKSGGVLARSRERVSGPRGLTQ